MISSLNIVNQNIIYIFKLLTKKRKSQLFFIFVLMLLTSITEVLSIGSIFPFLTIIFSNSDFASNNQYLLFLNSMNLSQNFYLIFFISMVLLAGIMRVMLIVAQTLISHRIGIDFGKKSIENILYQPYRFQINVNRGEIISIVSNKISDTVNYVLITSLNIISTTITSIFIFIFLLILDFKISFSLIFIFTFIYLLIVFLVKTRMYSNGVIWSNNQVLVLNNLREALNSLRELKIFNLEKYYTNYFNNKYSELRNAQAQNQILSQLPKNLIEVFAVLIFAFFLFYHSSRYEDLSNTIPLIGTFGMAASRLLPSFQNIYRNWSNLRSGKKILSDVLQILNKNIAYELKRKSIKKIKIESFIELKNINFSYDGKKNILSAINLKIRKNSLNYIIGKSGSGKSTLVDIISSLIYPSNGELMVNNIRINQKNSHQWISSISYLSQDFFLKNSSIKENIAYGEDPRKIDNKKLIISAKKANIFNFINSLDKGFDTQVGEKGVNISGGEKQRIALARAYYRDSQLLILDEFTSALDQNNTNIIMKNLVQQKKNMTIILITHDTSLIKYADCIYEIKNNKLIKK